MRSLLKSPRLSSVGMNAVPGRTQFDGRPRNVFTPSASSRRRAGLHYVCGSRRGECGAWEFEPPCAAGDRREGPSASTSHEARLLDDISRNFAMSEHRLCGAYAHAGSRLIRSLGRHVPG